MRTQHLRAVSAPQTLQVAIYARVSSDQQAERHTIDSQLAELNARAVQDGHCVRDDLLFIDNGHSGASLIRPALERLRDLVALSAVDVVYVHAPDRLARSYAHQVLLLEEFAHAGTQVVFLNRPIGNTPEDSLLLQLQGMFAEYERAKVLERSRRGKRHRAQSRRRQRPVPRALRLSLHHARGRRRSRPLRDRRGRGPDCAPDLHLGRARAPDAGRGLPALARQRHPKPDRPTALEPGHDPHHAAQSGLCGSGRLWSPPVCAVAAAASSAARPRWHAAQGPID